MAHSPMYKYGALLGALDQAMKRAVEEVLAGFARSKQLAAQRRDDPLAEREARSIALYRLRIRSERTLGRIHVARVAQQARRDLGLEEGDG